jgi:fatty acid desaturase
MIHHNHLPHHHHHHHHPYLVLERLPKTSTTRNPQILIHQSMYTYTQIRELQQWDDWKNSKLVRKSFLQGRSIRNSEKKREPSPPPYIYM